RPADRTDRPRVRGAAAVHAQSAGGPVKGADPRQGVGLRFRRQRQHRRTLRLVSAAEDRRSVRGSAEPLPHEAQSRLHPAGGSVIYAVSLRRLRLQTRLLIIAGLLLILVGAAIGAASWISVRTSLMSDLDAQLENMTRHARADGGPNQGPGGAGDQTPVDDALRYLFQPG